MGAPRVVLGSRALVALLEVALSACVHDGVADRVGHARAFTRDEITPRRADVLAGCAHLR